VTGRIVTREVDEVDDVTKSVLNFGKNEGRLRKPPDPWIRSWNILIHGSGGVTPLEYTDPQS
jgi:hypothetical protein